MMPQSINQVFVHLIFSTKQRLPLIDGSIRERVHGYLAALARDMGSTNVHVGGTADHVRILMDLPKDNSSIRVIEQLGPVKVTAQSGANGAFRT